MVIHNLSTIVEWELDSAYLLGYYTLMATPSAIVRETLPPSQLTECELIQELGSLEARERNSPHPLEADFAMLMRVHRIAKRAESIRSELDSRSSLASV